MPSSTHTKAESVASSPPSSVQSTHELGRLAEEEFEADVDDLMQKFEQKTATFEYWQESLNAEIRSVRAQVRNLRAIIVDLQRENKERLARIEEISAAIAGDEDAKSHVCRSAEIKKGRDTLVRMLTGNPTATWETYVDSVPEGGFPSAAREVLYNAAKDAIPIYEAKGRFVQPSPNTCTQKRAQTSKWMTIVRGEAREDDNIQVQDEIGQTPDEECTKRIEEAHEAQRLLELLKDEEILNSLK